MDELCLNLGLRRGEAIGLQWKDVDLERKVVHIKKTIQYIPRQGLKVKPHLKLNHQIEYLHYLIV